MTTTRYHLIIDIKTIEKVKDKKKQLTSFDINLNISRPKKEVKQSTYKEETQEQEQIDVYNLAKTTINGYRLLSNKYDEMIDFLVEKNKDKKITIDKNNVKLQEAIYKLFGELRTEITFKEYIELLKLSHIYAKELGKRQSEGVIASGY